MKRSRPLASTGKTVGQSGIAMAFARQGAIGADSKATAAMTDMVQGEGLPDGFLEKPKVPYVRAYAPTRSSKPQPRAPPLDPRLKPGPVFVASGGVIITQGDSAQLGALCGCEGLLSGSWQA